jgi:hypothetical protein
MLDKSTGNTTTCIKQTTSRYEFSLVSLREQFRNSFLAGFNTDGVVLSHLPQEDDAMRMAATTSTSHVVVANQLLLEPDGFDTRLPNATPAP